MKRTTICVIGVTITMVIAVSGCDGSTDPLCTNIGCTSGLTVSVQYPATADFTVVASGSGGETRSGTCSVRAGDPCHVRFADFEPDQLTVSVTGADQQVSVSLTPTYEIFQPNGPDCTPTCWNATVGIQLEYNPQPS